MSYPPRFKGVASGMRRDKRPNVLLVEDDDAIGALISAVLSSEFDMYSARTGAAALALAAETPPNLILLDVGLPDINGFEVCRRFKAHPLLAEVPVIFLTAHASAADEEDGLEAGGIDYIAKPINPTTLRARLRNHLELKRDRDALARMAPLDGLTGMANRRTFDDLLQREWGRQARTRQPLAIVMIDVDHFKAFNTAYGHGAGDDCLKQITKAAQGTLQRPADIVARYGGEEFVAILPDTALEGGPGGGREYSHRGCYAEGPARRLRGSAFCNHKPGRGVHDPGNRQTAHRPA